MKQKELKMKKENKSLEVVFLSLFVICCTLLNNMYMQTIQEHIINLIK